MKNDRVSKELLISACPSIKICIRSEVLGQLKSNDEMIELQNQLLTNPLVKKVMRWQQAEKSNKLHNSHIQKPFCIFTLPA